MGVPRNPIPPFRRGARTVEEIEFGLLATANLARAAVLVGDTVKSRKAYEDFFTLWKDADGDLTVLIEAKKEYEKVK